MRTRIPLVMLTLTLRIIHWHLSHLLLPITSTRISRWVSEKSSILGRLTTNRILKEEKNSLYNELLIEARNLSTAIQTQAVSEGLSQWDDILYLNYAAPDTPLDLLYGENLPRLRDLAAQFDPEKVMTLTVGFLFQS